MAQIIDLASARRRCAPAQHGRRPTPPPAQHAAPLLDEICRRLGPQGWIVVDGAGHVVEVHEPRRGA